MIDFTIATAVLILGAIGLVLLVRMERPVRRGVCTQCGYERGAAAGAKCPECGEPCP